MKLRVLSVVCLGLVVLWSCNDEQTSSSTYGNHCAMLGMTLGTLKRTVTITRTSDGQDTTYQTTLSGSLYAMVVDQLNHAIYNPDSLPVGTDPSRITFSSISSDGYVFYDSQTTGNDTIYTSGDTLDFRTTRYFTCYSYSGLAKQRYSVDVNIHQQDPETWHWDTLCFVDRLREVDAQRIYIANDTTHLFVLTDGGERLLLLSPTSDGTVWKERALEGEEVDVESVLLYEGIFYALADGSLCRLEGQEWIGIGASETFDALLAAGSDRVYALQGESVVQSTDLEEWTECELDDEGSLLPATNLSWAVLPLSTNAAMENVLISGLNPGGDGALWKKTSLIGAGSGDDAWGYYPQTEEILYQYPFFDNNTMVAYDGSLYCFGTVDDTLSLFYESPDYGRSWIAEDSLYVRPNGVEAVNLSAVVDEATMYLYVACGGSGLIIRGRENQAAVTDEDDEE